MNNLITKYESFNIEEPSTMTELLEKLSVVEKNILDSIKAEEIDSDQFIDDNKTYEDIGYIVNNGDFNSILKMKNLKKSDVYHTDDFETFLLSPFKYILLRDKNKNDLQDPDIIMLQTYNDVNDKWNPIRFYKINGDFNNFYEMLSSRTIELKHDNKKYIYKTSTRNDWFLSNTKGTEKFPKNIRKEDLLALIRSLS